MLIRSNIAELVTYSIIELDVRDNCAERYPRCIQLLTRL